MKNFILIALASVVFWLSCTSDKLDLPVETELEEVIKSASPTGELEHFILPDPSDFSNIPQDPNNPLTTAKIELGKMLFYETGINLLSKQEEGMGASCASCHNPGTGFMSSWSWSVVDSSAGSGQHGEGSAEDFLPQEKKPDVQMIRALNIMNVAFVPNTTWSGMYGATHNNVGTEEQWIGEAEINKMGLKGPESQSIEVFAKMHRLLIDECIADSLSCKPLFDSAFPKVDSSERYTHITAGLAIAAYMRTLISNEAPFQHYLKGDKEAMTEQEKRGALLFFGQAGCVKCHNGPPLNNPSQFFAVGVKDLFETDTSTKTDGNDKRKLGRGGFSNRPEDMYKFKVPQLYNMKDAPFFFHGGSKHSMWEVVEYFNLAEPENAQVSKGQIAPHFRPAGLSKREITDLVAFLENALYDPQMERYVPELNKSIKGLPIQGQLLQSDLGCQ